MNYRLSPRAAGDLESIANYISERNPNAADRLLDRFHMRWDLLTAQPRSGAPRDDLGRGLREVIVGEYLSIYRVSEGAVEILRVLHGRRNIAPKDFESLPDAD